jgi:dethiobiotin synthetase
MTILIVTGTDTGIGKTIVTAAIASISPHTTAVVKLAQTGVRPGEPGDIEEVGRLSGCTSLHEFARYPDPLSPHHAAMISELPELQQGTAVLRILELASEHDLVIVEGSGGVTVPFGVLDRWNVRDLSYDLDARMILVTSAKLGTLNHTFLASEYLDFDDPDDGGIVVGSYPADPGLAERYNLFDLAHMAPDGQLAGLMPEGLAQAEDFPAAARSALGVQLGGTFDWFSYRGTVQP